MGALVCFDGGYTCSIVSWWGYSFCGVVVMFLVGVYFLYGVFQFEGVLILFLER